MDNLTHSLIGFAAAKAGLEKLSPYATPLCIIAANAPDADIITTLLGPASYLHHHRGLSHSMIGTLLIALALPFVMYGVAAAFARWRRQPNAASLRGLILVSLVTSFSHPLLDWTNNYGVRPLLPWSDRWYYGDLVFILDPWLWLSLGGACFLLTATDWRKTGVWLAGAIFLTVALFWLPSRAGFSYPLLAKILWVAGIIGLICGRFAQAHNRRWGRGIAIAVLAGVVAYWGLLSLFHEKALGLVKSQIEAGAFGSQVISYAAMPTFANPLRWQAIVDTRESTYRFQLDVFEQNEAREKPKFERFLKPVGTEAMLPEQAAAQDTYAKTFLEFSRFPATKIGYNCAAQIIVQFADLRYSEPGGNSSGSFRTEVVIEATKNR